MEKSLKTSQSSERKPAVSWEEFERLKTQNSDLVVKNAELEQKLQWVMEQLGLAKKRQYGSFSEKSEYDQIGFFNEAETFANEDMAEPELQDVVQHTRKKPKRGMDMLPEGLPVEVVEHTLPADDQSCPKCGNGLHVMGQEVREELKIVPAKAIIVRHIRYVYSCRACAKDSDTGVPVIKAPIPKPVIKGSFASPEAVAHIAVQKYVMGVPLYRQQQEWKRGSITLSRQTMSNWLLRVSRDWLEPVYYALRQLLLERNVLHADETPVQVLKEDGKPAQSKSYMWLYHTGGDAKMPIVLFEYQPDRKAMRPQTFLEDFSGYLHADGYRGYQSLSENIVVVGCFAHVRRKFDEALKVLPKDQQSGSGALHGKRVCDEIFSIERQIKKELGQGPDLSPEEWFNKRLERRRELAEPILDGFHIWLNDQDVGKSAFGTAVNYTLGQWKYLKNYLMDGRLECSNNRAERGLRSFVIGRKAWLFSNTPKGAKSSAVLYSIVETAKANDLDPYSYLVHIFKTAPNCDMSDPNAVAALLPDKAPDECRITTKQTTLFDED